MQPDKWITIQYANPRLIHYPFVKLVQNPLFLSAYRQAFLLPSEKEE
jgi:hypothetical protein